ncbi:BMC domain-containing protein [Neobacillus sp. FSL H8-0543]|uniref:BMC domain-containing protein n=1 Tax=Neobacillus sp. FSL H8-0543 TaxID=2954672 RepID=UPI0031581157
MQALGLIETRGLLAAVESADAMLKAAAVTLIDKTHVGGGLVSIAVTGEVASVQAAVEAGTAAVRQINNELLISFHVIPRPHDEVAGLLSDVKSPENERGQLFEPLKAETKEEAEVEKTEVEEKVTVADREKINKSKIDSIVLKYGFVEAFEFLNSLKVTKLRTIAREYKDLSIAGRLISKADKKKLLAVFDEYYSTKQLD